MLQDVQGLLSWLWTPQGLPAFLFVITVVVFFHELGHFLMARSFGVKVDVFSVGFGREIVGRTDARGTRWKISWIPIGGYVKFSGDADAASTPDRAATTRMSARERESVLFFKPLYQRALVSAAGPFANFILAIVLMTGLNLYTGQVTWPPVIGPVTKGSPAEAAGIKPGDRITAIDGISITDFTQLPEIVSMRGGENLAIDLVRQNRHLTVHAVPRLLRQKDVLGEMETSFVIGVRPMPGLQPVRESFGVIGAFRAACAQTADIIETSLVGVVKMVQGHASADQVRGTFGIMDITHKVAELGFLALLNLTAILSVSIGLANLFPIPLLDGGHLLYYGCEAVLGRPLGERVQQLGFRFGVILIMGLLLASAYHDLARLNLF